MRFRREKVDESPSRLYDFWIPYPVVLVSTRSRKGIPNVAPYSITTTISYNPPIIVLGIKKTRRTYRNICDTKEFVVNIPTSGLIEKVNASSEHCPPNVDKFERVGLTKLRSLKVKAPSVMECIVHFECKLEWIRECGDHDLVVGKVIALRVNRELAEATPSDLKVKMKPVFYGLKRYYALGKFLGSR